MKENLHIQFDLIRHSQTARNLETNVVGQSPEEPLNETGKKQASQLGERFLKEGAHDYIFVSPYKRAQETMQIMTKDYPKNVPITTIDDLREINQGDGRNKLRSELYKPELKDYYEFCGMSYHHKNGESLFDVSWRVWEFARKEILDNPYTRTDKKLKIGIVSHGMCIKTFLHSVMQFDHRLCWRIDIENASVSKLLLKDGLWYVKSINDISHLKE
jgi:broad specificity phosphatase PhoE